MEHAQLEVSWLHPPEAQLVQDPALYTTHLVVSIHYTTQYTTLGGLYTLRYTIHYTWWSLYMHSTLYTLDGLHTLRYTIHYTWWSLYTTRYTTLGALYLLCVWCCHVLGIHSRPVETVLLVCVG